MKYILNCNYGFWTCARPVFKHGELPESWRRDDDDGGGGTAKTRPDNGGEVVVCASNLLSTIEELQTLETYRILQFGLAEAQPAHRRRGSGCVCVCGGGQCNDGTYGSRPRLLATPHLRPRRPTISWSWWNFWWDQYNLAQFESFIESLQVFRHSPFRNYDDCWCELIWFGRWLCSGASGCSLPAKGVQPTERGTRFELNEGTNYWYCLIVIRDMVQSSWYTLFMNIKEVQSSIAIHFIDFVVTMQTSCKQCIFLGNKIKNIPKYRIIQFCGWFLI